MEYTTLIQKECGHFGLIRNKLPSEMVHCSQCESRVRVVQSKLFDGREIPELNFFDMDDWISRQLIDRT